MLRHSSDFIKLVHSDPRRNRDRINQGSALDRVRPRMSSRSPRFGNRSTDVSGLPLSALRDRRQAPVHTLPPMRPRASLDLGRPEERPGAPCPAARRVLIRRRSGSRPGPSRSRGPEERTLGTIDLPGAGHYPKIQLTAAIPPRWSDGSRSFGPKRGLEDILDAK